MDATQQRRPRWSADEHERLCQLYPIMPAHEVAAKLGRSLQSVKQRIYNSNLRKNRKRPTLPVVIADIPTFTAPAPAATPSAPPPLTEDARHGARKLNIKRARAVLIENGLAEGDANVVLALIAKGQVPGVRMEP